MKTNINIIFFLIIFLCDFFTIKLDAKIIEVSRQKSTFFYGAQAAITGNITRLNGDFYPWKGNAEMAWDVNIPKDEKFDLYIIAGVPEESRNLQINLVLGEISYDFTVQPTTGWVGGAQNYQRIKIGSALSLTKGEKKLILKTTGITGDRALFHLRSIELVPISALPAIEKDRKRAVASRASTEWMAKTGYGLMFHWTSQSVNPDGSKKPYEQGVNDFDVIKFADMVEETGAGYVMLTIGHAEQYCPAPIKSWEKTHPGKTTKRDLIGEMADELNKRDIKFFCYLNSYGTAKFRNRQSDQEFYKTFKDMLTEIGNRYKKKIAGYWFDCWYQIFEGYPDIPFEDFFKICKTGNKDRIFCLNSWIYPPVTPWQEYWAGETCSIIPPPVNGLLQDGCVPDLRYQVLLIMEPYWVQDKAEMPEPRFTSAQLSEYIRNCSANGGAVTINMGMYQNGTVGDKALQVMKEVKQKIR